jgi:uncharacterized protein (DUF433 family)
MHRLRSSGYDESLPRSTPICDKLHRKGGCIMDPLLERISINPQICGGKPCIKGTRVWVSLILDLLASGMSGSELLGEYRELGHEDILAAIAYGAEAARERMIPVPADRIP